MDERDFGLIFIRPPQISSSNQRGFTVFHIRYVVFGALLAAAAIYPVAAYDASKLPVESGEYKLPASLDSEVATDLETEEWARVWRPTADGNYPLVIFLHGNHGTCGH